MNTVLKLSLSLEYECNKLQFVMYKNPLHWGKQTKATHLYIMLPCLQQNLQKESYLDRLLSQDLMAFCC